MPGRDGDVLVTGLPLAALESTMGEVEFAELAIFAAALLFTGIIGTAFVRLSLRPLRRVAATATRVTELPLASGEVKLPERVPGADPRTEVGQVGAAFNRMLGHVESALTRRAASEARLRGFAADASHELRTPLAAIRGYAELARLGYVTRVRISQGWRCCGWRPHPGAEPLPAPDDSRPRPLQMYDLLPIAVVLNWKTQ